jgi:hypothetical protein
MAEQAYTYEIVTGANPDILTNNVKSIISSKSALPHGGVAAEPVPKKPVYAQSVNHDLSYYISRSSGPRDLEKNLSGPRKDFVGGVVKTTRGYAQALFSNSEEYKILENDDPNKLSSAVTEMLNTGNWDLLGGVTTGNRSGWAQAMMEFEVNQKYIIIVADNKDMLVEKVRDKFNSMAITVRGVAFGTEIDGFAQAVINNETYDVFFKKNIDDLKRQIKSAGLKHKGEFLGGVACNVWAQACLMPRVDGGSRRKRNRKRTTQKKY